MTMKKPKSLTPAQKMKLLDKIVNSPTYEKAYHDKEFINMEELRPVRLQLELLKPEMKLAELDVRSTVIVFGSARIGPESEAKADVARLRRRLKRSPRDRALAERLVTAERLLAQSHFYDEARRFGYLATRASLNKRKRDFV